MWFHPWFEPAQSQQSSGSPYCWSRDWTLWDRGEGCSCCGNSSDLSAIASCSTSPVDFSRKSWLTHALPILWRTKTELDFGVSGIWKAVELPVLDLEYPLAILLFCPLWCCMLLAILPQVRCSGICHTKRQQAYLDKKEGMEGMEAEQQEIFASHFTSAIQGHPEKQNNYMGDVHLVVSAFHEACEVVIHVVEDHVNATLHIVYLVRCNIHIFSHSCCSY